MIAFSCVHCGERMALSDSGDYRKAECRSCGHTLSLPGGKRADQQETRLAPAPHQMTTRIEAVPKPLAFTAMLSPPEAPDELGRLGGYRVLEVVGAGGMGVVFRAEDPVLLREVALKAMLPALAASETARARFLREARGAASLQHDRVVAVYQVGEDRGTPFLAMPFLRGETLESRLERGPIPISECVRIGKEIAEGLAAIHEQGLVHRDVKPANVWLEGPAGRVKVLDFGLARAGGDAALTRDGSLVGSPAFMSPEQARRRPVDARSDLFALGVVLYAMVAGRLPFEGDDALAVLLAITSEEPPVLSASRPDVPEELERIVSRLLSKDSALRPSRAAEVMRELELIR